MEIERVKEILKERGFVIDTCEKEEDYIDEIYLKGENYVNIYANPTNVDVFISNPRYNFGTDDNDRDGINLHSNLNRKYELTEENFIYCLDIQEDPRLHEIKLLKAFFELSEWLHNSFEPVAKDLGIGLEEYNTPIDEYFPIKLGYIYEFKDDEDCYFSVVINAFTAEVMIEFFKSSYKNGIGEDYCDLGFIYRESPEFVYSALEEVIEQFKNSSARS